MSLGDAVEILLKSETLSDVERRCLNWHIANVEGPSAANINRLVRAGGNVMYI